MLLTPGPGLAGNDSLKRSDQEQVDHFSIGHSSHSLSPASLSVGADRAAEESTSWASSLEADTPTAFSPECHQKRKSSAEVRDSNGVCSNGSLDTEYTKSGNDINHGALSGYQFHDSFTCDPTAVYASTCVGSSNTLVDTWLNNSNGTSLAEGNRSDLGNRNVLLVNPTCKIGGCSRNLHHKHNHNPSDTISANTSITTTTTTISSIIPAGTTEDLRRFLVSTYDTLSREVGYLLDTGQPSQKTWEHQPHGVFKKVDNVKLLDRFSGRKLIGTLYLTATHLIFVDAQGRRETWILHMHMGHVEKLTMTAEGCPLLIRCRNFLCITFIVPRERECQDIFLSLLEFSRPAEINKLYAFNYTSSEGLEKAQGWDMFDLQSEFMRMGAPNEHWVITNLNSQYELCDTYPSLLYVPANATTPVLVGSSKFRSRGRLPVLSYLHGENNATLTRCSQPLSGFSARCVEDEQMLQAILRANPGSNYMYVVDTRPKINAMVNKAQGKGYENESFYSNMKFQFLGIENIHVMRASLQKLIELSELKKPSMNDFFNRLEGSGWLKHIGAVIDTSAFIARAISDGTSVLVHCSDGWDRTAQTCSLAGIMLDPYYRTMQGFQALIEKEWLGFGHKFTDRCGLLESVEVKETSPVFTQFLECVWQMMQQFPCAFQFNERFLLTIHDHIYSCQFGTFIGNCEKDRLDLRLSERTFSLWGYLSLHSTEYLNPLYKKTYEIKQPVIIPNPSPQSLRYWRGMYNRFESGIHPRENVQDIISAAKDHTVSLEDHVLLLEKRVTQICKLLGKSEEAIQRKLQGHVSMDSIEGYLSGHIGDNSSASTNAATPNFCHNKAGPFDVEPLELVNFASKGSFDSEAQLEGSKGTSVGGSMNHIKSDSESGFDEASSQLSRSGGVEELAGGAGGGMPRSPSSDLLTVEQLVAELKTVAVGWRSFRNVHSCSCASPFDHDVKKFHCWKCGQVFCVRCIARSIPLPGHYHRRPVPVCKPCYREVRRSPSTEFPLS